MTGSRVGGTRQRGPSSSYGDRAAVRALVPLTIVLVLLVIVAVIGVSPLALGGISGISDDWENLSFIGQAYGAVSALFAGLALAGVIATLVVQTRELRTSRELALRD